MLLRAIAIWLILMVLAIANGVFRNSVVTPRIGEQAGHVVSTIVLCLIIILVTLLAIRWIAPLASRDALLVGVFWVVLTVGFEFVAGHYAFGHSWERLLVDYDVSRGRVWLLVPIVTLFAPWLAVAIRGILPPPSHLTLMRPRPVNRQSTPLNGHVWAVLMAMSGARG